MCRLWLAAILCFPFSQSVQAETTLAEKASAEGRSFAELTRRIDALFDACLNSGGQDITALVDDSTYLRRVYLDLAGTIPSVSQARDFLNDANPEKRAKLVDRLIADLRSSAHWSRVYRRIMIPNGSPTLQSGTWTISRHLNGTCRAI